RFYESSFRCWLVLDIAQSTTVVSPDVRRAFGIHAILVKTRTWAFNRKGRGGIPAEKSAQ
ncbi:MAG TPA: hypothetical protein VK666_19670, partial [Chryseolinea sp.]|nr:hypothetical protein [Chryseolinea sp.]